PSPNLGRLDQLQTQFHQARHGKPLGQLSGFPLPIDKRAASMLRQVHAAVDVEDVAGDVGGFVASEENDGGGNIFASSHATERDAYFQFFFHFVGKDGSHGRLDEPRSHGVDGDVARSNLNGNRFGKPDDSSFRGDVVGLSGIASFRDNGRNVDDAPGTSLHHRRQHLLDAEMCAGE